MFFLETLDFEMPTEAFFWLTWTARAFTLIASLLTVVTAVEYHKPTDYSTNNMTIVKTKWLLEGSRWAFPAKIFCIFSLTVASEFLAMLLSTKPSLMMEDFLKKPLTFAVFSYFLVIVALVVMSGSVFYITTTSMRAHPCIMEVCNALDFLCLITSIPLAFYSSVNGDSWQLYLPMISTTCVAFLLDCIIMSVDAAAIGALKRVVLSASQFLVWTAARFFEDKTIHKVILASNVLVLAFVTFFLLSITALKNNRLKTSAANAANAQSVKEGFKTAVQLMRSVPMNLARRNGPNNNIKNE